jgi:hypothetical protein
VLVLAALLVFGYFVLIRVVKRNLTSDLYKQKLHRVRKWFTPNKRDPRREWVAFDPFQVHPKREISYWGPKTGGWQEILILVNASMAGGLTAACVPTHSWLCKSMFASLGGLSAWVLLVARTRYLIRHAVADVRMHEK